MKERTGRIKIVVVIHIKNFAIELSYGIIRLQSKKLKTNGRLCLSILTPRFFLWHHLKTLVYQTHLNSIEKLLLNSIVTYADVIRNDYKILFRVEKRYLRNFKKCIHVQGTHFQYHT